jgi:PleD family two-component response regulator
VRALTSAAGRADQRTTPGGEEFVVLMPATEARAAVTASIGVATSHDAGELEALAKLADSRLYAAGRDRVVAG